MTWDWDCHNTPHRWSLSVGAWNATVRRTGGARNQWQAAIEHTAEPYDCHAGPVCRDAMVARTWCLAKIAELRGK